MSATKRIVRNTTYLTSAFVGQKILSFIYFTLIARLVGAVDTGAYVFALSYSTVFSVFVDFGLAPFIQREIAQHPEKTRDFVQHTLFSKLFYALAAAVVGVVIINLIESDPLILRMVYIAMTLMVVDSFNQTVWAVFRGHQQLQFESISVVVNQILVLLIGLTGLLGGWPITILIIALLAGSLFAAVFSSVLLRMKMGFWPLPAYHAGLRKHFIAESLPFGLAGAFTRVFSSIDTVLLRLLSTPAAVGFYAVPNKVVFAAQFIPSAFAAAIYPAMSHFHKHDRGKMVEVFEQAFTFLLILSVPMAIGLFLLAPTVIIEFYTGEFAPSIIAMYILAWGIIFGFLEFPVGALLSAMGKQKLNTWSRGIVMVVNIVLNLLLIPLYSFVGAAIAALVSYFLLVALGIFWVRNEAHIGWDRLAIAGIKILAAAILMGGFVYVFLPVLHFVLVILLAAIVYAVAVVLFKVVDLKHIGFLLKSLRRT